MADQTVIRTIRVRGVPEGIDELTGKLKQLAGAQENVAIVSEQSARRSLSVQDAWKKQTMALDESARMYARAASATKVADNALREGLISQSQYADRLNLIAEKFGVATAAAEKFARAQSLSAVNSASAINQRLGVKDDMGTAVRANDIAAYGKSLDDLRARFNPLFAAERNHKTQVEEINRAAKVGAISEKERADAVEASRQAFVRQTQVMQGATVQAGKFAGQTGLNRYELLNLSRQMQDVGVSLASGQSPFVVLTQQGSQILDVFQATTGSVRGFFAQAIGWAGRFATSTAGVVTGIGAIGAAVGYMAYQWSSAQTEITRVLMTTGRNSGATRDDINRIATEAAAATRQSTSEARELALALAATGKIGVEQIASLTRHGYNLAKVLGVDAPEANKLLAESFADPAKGVDLLNEKLGGFSRGTSDAVKRLATQFRFDEARSALERGLIPTLERAGEVTSTLSKIADGTTKFFKELGTQMSIGLDRLAGNNPAAEKLADAQNRLNMLQATQVDRAGTNARRTFFDAQLERDIEAARAKVEEFRKEVDKVNGDRFKEVRDGVIDFTQAMEPGVTQIDILRDRMVGLRNALSDPGVIAGMTSQQFEQSVRVLQTLEAQVGQVDQLRAAYGSVNDAVNRQLHSLQLQTNLVNARTGAERQAAQFAIDYANAYERVKNAVEATKIAEDQRALRVAQLNASLDQQLRSLQEQAAVLRGVSEVEQARIKAAQDYQKVVDAQGDTLKAAAIAAQTIADARQRQDARELANAERDAARATQQRAAAAHAAAIADERAAEATARIRAENERIAHLMRFIPFGIRGPGEGATGLTYGAGQLFTGKDGGYTQFNPAGYKFGENLSLGTFTEQINNQLGYGKSTTEIFNQLLGGGLMKMPGVSEGIGGTGKFGELISGPAGLDTEKLAALDRLIATMSEDQQKLAIQSELQVLRSMGASLERDEAIKRLTDSLEQLTDATKDNTAATETVTDVLSPFYTTDPRNMRLGYRAFADGGIMTPRGELPINHYAGGGIASSAQVAVFGEGRTPEAYVPVPSGRIPVEMRIPANSNLKEERPIHVSIIVQGNADANTVSALKSTAFQQAQAMRRVVAG